MGSLDENTESKFCSIIHGSSNYGSLIMGETIPDKNVEINGKVIGTNSILKLSVKTALWIIGGIFSLVMSILTYSYFDLKSDVKAAQEADKQSQQEFIERVDGKVEKMNSDIQTIRIDQATIKGDIRLILDRQTRDNPVRETNIVAQPAIPPPTSPDTIQ